MPAMSRSRREWLILGATILVVMGTLAATSANGGVIQWNYLAGLLIIIAIYAVFALGLSLEFGFTGLLNFGHVGFMAIGAYTYGILMMRPQDRPTEAPGIVGALYDASASFAGTTAVGFIVTFFIAILAAALVAAPLLILAGRIPGALSSRTRSAMGGGAGLVVAIVVFANLFPLSAKAALGAAALLAMLSGIILAVVAGLLLGLPTLRLREDYLAIVTIGAAEILRSVILNEEAWTRGTRNILNFHRPIIDWSLSTAWWDSFAKTLAVKPASLAILTASVLALVLIFILLETLVRSPWGRVLTAIREDEDAAASLGKNVLWVKLQSLMLGSAVAAVAGILLVTYLANIAPQHFMPIVTFYAFIIIVMGGVSNHKGAIAGAFLLWGIFSLSQNLPALAKFGLTAGPPQAIFIGVVLILVMMFRPQGLVGSKEELVFAK